MKTIYKILCEWDMPFKSIYHTTHAGAEKDIEAMDWLGLVDLSLEEVEEEGLVSIDSEQLMEIEDWEYE